VVEHTLVGKKVIVRLRHAELRVFDGSRLVVTYTVPEGKGEFVQDPRFYAALKADRELQARKYAAANNGRPAGRKHKGRAIKQTTSPCKPPNPIDVVSFEAKNSIDAIQVKDVHTLEVQHRPLAEYAELSGEVLNAG
jgi:hypothetical protein